MPSTNRPVLVVEGKNGNVARFVDHGGTIYMEVRAYHHGTEIYSLVEVDRLRLVPLLLGWFS